MGLKFGGGRRRVCSVKRQLSFVGSYLADEEEVKPTRRGGAIGGWNIAAVITRLEQASRLRGQARRDFTEGGVDESP